MWPDFKNFDTVGNDGTLAFGFPHQGPPAWRQHWQAVVTQVAVAPDSDAKDALLDSFARGSGVRTLGFVNAHAMNRAVDDPVFAGDLLALDHLVRDGIGVHALYRMIGSRSGMNLNGTDLLPELIARFAGQRIALFGTRLPIVDAVAATLRREHGCEVITADGFRPDGYYLERVAAERPALVVLGMGMPKQERVARQLKFGLTHDVAIVCGGAILDFLSGDKPRAPYWMRKSGLEWVFRLSLEPKRLFGRYVVGNPLFLIRSALLALLPEDARPRPRALPERPPASEPFGIGGPAAALPERRVVAAPEPAAPAIAASPAPALRAVPASAVSVFSANRPVVAREDLFGREPDLDRLLAWVLDQSGNALIYGPRGYGKTSLVRVFGEIADSRRHIVLYASCSRDIAFDALMQTYLRDIPDCHLADNGLPPPATVQDVAARLAAVSGTSLVLIIDEFDRIERDDTRQSIIELVKDVSDLTASVRFVIVGVATDASAILGYHPSIHRCITCVPLARLDAPAVREMFVGKARADGLIVGEDEIADVVALTAGSAYHAQLIGQKLVSKARHSGDMRIDARALDLVIDEIIDDAMLIDHGVQRLERAMRDRADNALLLQLAQRALAGRNDVIDIGDTEVALLALCARLAGDGIVQPVNPDRPRDGLRFANAFTPQLLLMIAHRAAAPVKMLH